MSDTSIKKILAGVANGENIAQAERRLLVYMAGKSDATKIVGRMEFLKKLINREYRNVQDKPERKEAYDRARGLVEVKEYIQHITAMNEIALREITRLRDFEKLAVEALDAARQAYIAAGSMPNDDAETLRLIDAALTKAKEQIK